MSSHKSPQARNRKAREQAKHVPSRKTSRVYSARTALTRSVEDSLSALRTAPLSQAMASDVAGAYAQIVAVSKQVTDKTPGASATLKDLSSSVGHVAAAQKVLVAASRLVDQLRQSSSAHVVQLEQAMDSVAWHLRAGRLDGSLTAAVAAARDVVAQAEVVAARLRAAA